MKRHQNLLLLASVVLLTALPLALVRAPHPGAGSAPVQTFTGADDRARELIGELAPSYQPWFQPVLLPASNEISSLLFALEAAVGAGFLGFAFGVFITRERLRHRKHEQAEGLPTC